MSIVTRAQHTRPALTPLSARATEIVSVARALLEEHGRAALTMRALADRLGIRAASLYKHSLDKAAVEAALIERALAEIGEVLYPALSEPDPLPPCSASTGTPRWRAPTGTGWGRRARCLASVSRPGSRNGPSRRSSWPSASRTGRRRYGPSRTAW